VGEYEKPAVLLEIAIDFVIITPNHYFLNKNTYIKAIVMPKEVILKIVIKPITYNFC